MESVSVTWVRRLLYIYVIYIYIYIYIYYDLSLIRVIKLPIVFIINVFYIHYNILV